MLNYLKEEANLTLTENGAVTYESTMSECLDLFATIGALRKCDDGEIITRFTRAYAENPDMAMKLLFFARDIRGGLGERRIFRVIMSWLAKNRVSSAQKNIGNIPEYGRYDDVLSLLGTDCEKEAITIIKSQFEKDMSALDMGGEVSLLGKWLPSVNASNADTVKYAKYIAKQLGMNDASYRKALTKLRAKIRIIENNLRTGDYTFDYEKQPSRAMLKYRKAFSLHDGSRYHKYLEAVASGNAVMHTGTLTPYDIIAPCLHDKMKDHERKAVDAAWIAQEDFTGDENAIAVVDGSGSMYCQSNPMPAAIAQSLGIYFAEHNRGIFHNHFITFSSKPRLIEIKGKDIFEKVQYCMSYDECSNTNIQKVFDLILHTAVKNNIPQNELPSTIYIISDMEFDCCAEDATLTNFGNAKAKYEAAGYTLPRIVFWNVSSRNNQQPVRKNEQGVALVSGSSPRVFGMLKSGNLSPYAFMLEVLSDDRYANISA